MEEPAAPAVEEPAAAPTEEPAAAPTEEPAFNCAAFKLTSPIGYVNNGPTTFYWDPLPNAPNANYWLTVWNDQGQQVGIVDAGNGTSATVDLSVGKVGGGFTFSYEVNVLINGANVCPASGSVGQRPAS